MRRCARRTSSTSPTCGEHCGALAVGGARALVAREAVAHRNRLRRRRDWPTSAPGLAHIGAGPVPTSAPGQCPHRRRASAHVGAGPVPDDGRHDRLGSRIDRLRWCAGCLAGCVCVCAYA
jgi:hypothetical protein